MELKNKFSLTAEVVWVIVWKFQVKNQSLLGLLPHLSLLKCILLIIEPKDRVLLHELKECIKYLIRELDVGHLSSFLSSSFCGLGGGLGGGWWNFSAGPWMLLSDIWLLRHVNFPCLLPRPVWLEPGIVHSSSSCLCLHRQEVKSPIVDSWRSNMTGLNRVTLHNNSLWTSCCTTSVPCIISNYFSTCRAVFGSV